MLPANIAGPITGSRGRKSESFPEDDGVDAKREDAQDILCCGRGLFVKEGKAHLPNHESQVHNREIEHSRVLLKELPEPGNE